MSDIDPHKHYRVREVCHLIPGNPHLMTVWRWILTGLGPQDRRRKLQTVKVGGKRFVIGQDLLVFLAEGNEQPGLEIRTPAARRKASEAAGKRLEEIGVK